MVSSTLRSMRSTVGNSEKDAVILQEHKLHTADELRSMRGALQPVRIRGKVKLILRAPIVTVGEWSGSCPNCSDGV